MAKDDPHFRLRIPPDLKEAIEEAAATNSRSINAEIMYRLQNSFDPDYLGSEVSRLKANYAASASSGDMAWRMLADKRALYVVLDTNGKPISWDEITAHVSAISQTLEEPIESVNVAVFTPEKVSSRDRQQEWMALLDFYHRQRSGEAEG